MREWTRLASWLALVCLLGCAAKMQVQEGQKTVCRLCQKVIAQDTRTLSVPKDEARRHKVRVVSDFCTTCTDEVTSAVKRYMASYNDQKTGLIRASFSSQDKRAAEEMAGKSTGDYYREILNSGPGVGQSEKDYARRALSSPPYRYPLDVSPKLVPVEEGPFRGGMPSEYDRSHSSVYVIVDDPYQSGPIAFLMIKEQGAWKISDIG